MMFQVEVFWVCDAV